MGLRVHGLTNSFVEVAGDTRLSPQDEVSISFWVNVLSPPPGYAGLIYKAAIEPTSNGFQDRSYSLWAQANGSIQIASTPDGASSQVYCDSPAGSLPLGQFAHVVGIISTKSHKMTVYVNGTRC